METNNNVSIGPTTIVGWMTALLALLPAIIKSVEEGQVSFNGPEKYLAILGIASGLITQIGRYLQAHKMITATTIHHGSYVTPQDIDFEEGKPVEQATHVTRPESALKPDGPNQEITTAVTPEGI
jgi:hypothetical protein